MKVKVNSDLLYTQYFWGDKSDILNKELEVIESSVDGSSYLCISEKGLVDLDKRDCVEF